MNTVVVYEAVGCTYEDWIHCRYKVKHLGSEVIRLSENENITNILNQFYRAIKEAHGGCGNARLILNNAALSALDITSDNSNIPDYIAVCFEEASEITPENIFKMK